MCRIVAHVPDPSSTTTETNATFEKRGTTVMSALTTVPGREASPEHEQADQPSEPERARDEMEPVEQQRETPEARSARRARRRRG